MARVDIHRHQVPPGVVVVVGVEQRPAGRIEGGRRHPELHRPLHVDELADAAVLQRNHAGIGDDAGILEGADQRIRLRVVEGARHGAERLARDAAAARDGMLAHRAQVGLLEFVLPGDPLVPRGLERLAEYLGELARVVRLAPFAALQPFDHGLRRMDVGEVGVEPGAVQIGIGDGLEIRGNALGYQAEVAVEMRVVADHRAEHHFIEGALGPADAARHPGFHECRRAFDRRAQLARG